MEAFNFMEPVIARLIENCTESELEEAFNISSSVHSSYEALSYTGKSHTQDNKNSHLESGIIDSRALLGSYLYCAGIRHCDKVIRCILILRAEWKPFQHWCEQVTRSGQLNVCCIGDGSGVEAAGLLLGMDEVLKDALKRHTRGRFVFDKVKITICQIADQCEDLIDDEAVTASVFSELLMALRNRLKSTKFSSILGSAHTLIDPDLPLNPDTKEELSHATIVTLVTCFQGPQKSKFETKRALKSITNAMKPGALLFIISETDCGANSNVLQCQVCRECGLTLIYKRKLTFKMSGPVLEKFARDLLHLFKDLPVQEYSVTIMVWQNTRPSLTRSRTVSLDSLPIGLFVPPQCFSTWRKVRTHSLCEDQIYHPLRRSISATAETLSRTSESKWQSSEDFGRRSSYEGSMSCNSYNSRYSEENLYSPGTRFSHPYVNGHAFLEELSQETQRSMSLKEPTCPVENSTKNRRVTYSHPSQLQWREYVFKVLVIGDIGTGKSSLISRFVYNVFPINYVATLGVEFALKVVQWTPNTLVRLQLWDIAGQEGFQHMTRVYYKEADGAFIVFDVTRPATLAAVVKWKQDLDNKVRLADGSCVPCILLANKCDLTMNKPFNNSRYLDKFCQQHGFTKWFLTSAKGGTNVEEALNFLTSKVLDNQRKHRTDSQRDTDSISLQQYDFRNDSAKHRRRKTKNCCFN